MPTDYAQFIPPTDTAVPASPDKPLRRPAMDLRPEPTAKATDSPPSTLDPLLSLPEVCRLTTFSRASVYRLVSEGTFPAPLKLGVGPDPKRGRIAWLASDITRWMSQLPRTV